MNKNNLVLIVIILLAVFLRIWNLDKIPIELFGDEIDLGLQANSILKTGKDYFGNSFPVSFKSFTEYRLPLQIYSAIPTIKIFGLNEWGVRLPSVFYGALSILGIFFLAKELFNIRVGFISAFFLSISPWHLHFTRQANDAGTILPLLLFGIYFFNKGLNKFPFFLVAVSLFVLTLYSYSVATVFSPLLFLSLVFIYRDYFKKLRLKKIVLVWLIAFIISLPYVKLMFSGSASQRFTTISIFSNKSITDGITLRRSNEDKKISPIFNNKPVAYFYEWSGNYLRSMSPDFLFFRGDPNLRHSIGSGGELYLFQFFLMITGLLLIIFLRNNAAYVILVWLLLSPLPSTITNEGGNHAGRLIPLLPPLLILSAIGLNYLFEKRKIFKFKFALFLLTILATLDISFYFYKYYIEWSNDSWRFWQSGYKEAISYIQENDKRYTRIFLNNTYEPSLPRFLFYYNYDPNVFISQNYNLKSKEQIVPGFNGFSLGDKYYFGIVSKLIKDEGFAELLEPNDVYLVNVRDEVGADDWISSPPKNVKILKTIYNPFQKPIFFIVSKKL